MPERGAPRIAIVDYGLGNLFSVRQACVASGGDAVITSSIGDIEAADLVILPGIGAFGDAMSTLRALRLVDALLAVVAAGKPLVGICLGMQLLLDVSYEFGRHDGLGVIPGAVERIPCQGDGALRVKVPQVGWNRIYWPGGTTTAGSDPWASSLLSGLPDGEFMYFIHSYIVKPADPGVVLAVSRYGAAEFCVSLRCGNVTAWQFHPERSGPAGLRLYRNLVEFARRQSGNGEGHA